jgi:threonine dehydrogenase-like Zn-dependent dehydrogenase
MNLPASMRSLQLIAPGRLVEAQAPVPKPMLGEILVRTVATTICTSDLNDIARNPFGIVLPRILGHEGAGIVAAVGEGVADMTPDDRVAAHPVIPCRDCSDCRNGREHLCRRMGHLGIDRDGTFAEFFCVRSDRVRRVPHNMDMAVAALLEPVAVCLQAIERSRLKPGESLLIVGDGPFGNLIARLAASRNPRNIIVVGRHQNRLQQVKHAVPILHRSSHDTIAAVKEAAGEDGVDAAILAVASEDALNLCLAALRAQGRLVLFSALANPCPADWFKVHTREIEILGSCNDNNLIDSSLNVLTHFESNLAALVTHRLPFDDWARAFDLAGRRKDEALKVALIFGGHT